MSGSRAVPGALDLDRELLRRAVDRAVRDREHKRTMDNHDQGLDLSVTWYDGTLRGRPWDRPGVERVTLWPPTARGNPGGAA